MVTETRSVEKLDYCRILKDCFDDFNYLTFELNNFTGSDRLFNRFKYSLKKFKKQIKTKINFKNEIGTTGKEISKKKKKQATETLVELVRNPIKRHEDINNETLLINPTKKHRPSEENELNLETNTVIENRTKIETKRRNSKSKKKAKRSKCLKPKNVTQIERIFKFNETLDHTDTTKLISLKIEDKLDSKASKIEFKYNGESKLLNTFQKTDNANDVVFKHKTDQTLLVKQLNQSFQTIKSNSSSNSKEPLSSAPKIDKLNNVPIVKKMIDAIESRFKNTIKKVNFNKNKDKIPKVIGSTILDRKQKISIGKSEKKRKSLKQFIALKENTQKTDELKTNYVASNQIMFNKSINNLKSNKTPRKELNYLENKKINQSLNVTSKSNKLVSKPLPVSNNLNVNKQTNIKTNQNLTIDREQMKKILEQRMKKMNTQLRKGSTSTASTISSYNSNNTLISSTSFKTVNSTFEASFRKPQTNQIQTALPKANDVTLILRNNKNNTTITRPNVVSFKETSNNKQAKTFGTTNTTKPWNNSCKSNKNSFMEKSLTKQPKLNETKIDRNNQNYNINDLNSEDETDDEEMPNKPIPEWATDKILMQSALIQAHKSINFTKLFKGSLKEDVDLETVFKIKKKNFNVRTSSANWKSPPVWK